MQNFEKYQVPQNFYIDTEETKGRNGKFAFYGFITGIFFCAVLYQFLVIPIFYTH